MNEVLDYLDKKKMTYKLSDGANGKEAIVMVCPYCKDTKYHFYFNLINKVFYCHKCNQKGTLFTLKADQGDVANVVPVSTIPEEETQFSNEDIHKISEAYANLLYDKEASLYVMERGFTREAIDYFRLGASDEEGIKWLWMPYIDAVGTVKNVKKRSITGEKKFKRWVGRDSILFNEKALDLQTDSIILCEGETDTIALWSMGIKNVVGVPTGAKGFNPTWVMQLDKYQKIYIAYDNDQAGDEGSHIISRRLGEERCYRIKLPPTINDMNDYVKAGHTKDDFEKLITGAKILDVQYVSQIGDAIQRRIQSMWIDQNKEKDALKLPWNRLQKLTDGFVPGDLIILASPPGMGKSSLGLNILYGYAKTSTPCLLFSLEMSVDRLLPRIASMVLQKNSREVENFEDLQKAAIRLKSTPMYLAYVYKKPSFDFVADTVRMCVRRYGIKFLVFDNLHFLVRSLSDQVREVSLITNNFKLLAEELGIPILLIARPRKLSSEGKPMTNLDLKDSADIEGDADIIILLHRKRKSEGDTDNTTLGIFESKCLVRVSKCRYAPGGDAYLSFDDKTCTIKEEVL